MKQEMQIDVQVDTIGRWGGGNYPHPAGSRIIHQKNNAAIAVPNMETIERETNDVDEMFAWEEGWDRRYLQLSKGPLQFSTQQVFLPNLMIEWNSYGQSILCQEVLESSAFFFGFLINSTGPAVYRGRELLETEALVYHRGFEQEYRVRPQSETLVLSIIPPLTEALGAADPILSTTLQRNTSPNNPTPQFRGNNVAFVDQDKHALSFHSHPNSSLENDVRRRNRIRGRCSHRNLFLTSDSANAKDSFRL